MNEEKHCHFWRENNFCGCLSETQCDGFSLRCTFRKTTEEFIIDRDNAVLLNRKRGNCEKCQYRPFDKCKLSTEV